MMRMKGSAYWIIYEQNTNIERSCDTLIQYNDNKKTTAFEHSCVLINGVQAASVSVVRLRISGTMSHH